MYPIGEFSLITRLSVKTLRYYHEEGILLPDYIDDDSGYRYYREESVERAAVVTALRAMEFSVADIRQVLEEYRDDTDAVEFLEKQKVLLENKIQHYRKAADSCADLIEVIRKKEMNTKDMIYEVTEKKIEDIIFAGVRFTGKYNEVGKRFSMTARAAGRYIAGAPLCLYFDGEYKEIDADIEAGFPVSKTIDADGVHCRIIKGGKAVTLVHKGPYAELGCSYEKIFSYIEKKKLKASIPSREVYIKGPGMLIKGNSKNYLTEIQVFFEEK